MGKVSAHVLDTAIGRPAAGIVVRLDVLEPDGSFRVIGTATTNGDGRVGDLLSGVELAAATYRAAFEVEPYFARTTSRAFYPRIEILFRVVEPAEHFHIPLLLSPFGYSTYRGS